MGDKYKQIGNAVPVNLAWAVGRSLIRLFNDIQTFKPEETQDCREAVREIISEQSKLVVVKDKATQTSTIKHRYQQLNFIELFDQFALENIQENSMVNDCEIKGYGKKESDIDDRRRVLISLVKKDNEKMFLDGTARIYYTGKRFPTTIELNKLYYFMPYVKGKGVRDLYFIKTVRLGYRKEGTPDEDKSDLRLVFEVEYVRQLLDDYKPLELEIWHSFTDTTIENIL